MELSFDNTEIAFAHKSKRDLWRAKKLFQAFSYPFLVDYGPSIANAALTIKLPIKGIIKGTLFHQFCGGETIEESYPSALELHKNGIGAILDYSVEGKGNTESFKRTHGELKHVIQYAAKRPEFPFAVFKCTGIGSFSMFQDAGVNPKGKESVQFKEFYGRFEELCSLAYQNKVKLLIDAEESWIQNAIAEVTYEMMEKYNKDEAIIFNTIQMYRTTRIEEIEKQISAARNGGYKLGFKLVRGAYMEKERERAEELNYHSPIQLDKHSTDADYNKAVTVCFKNRELVEVMAGSHNEESAYHLAKLIQDAGVEHDDKRFWFAQLYGMSDHISFNLAKAGFNVAKYLPYGPVKEVLPYLSRRAKENSSVKGQAGRELNLLDNEIKRRKSIQKG